MKTHQDRTQNIKTIFEIEGNTRHHYCLFGRLFCLGWVQDMKMYASAIASTNCMWKWKLLHGMPSLNNHITTHCIITQQSKYMVYIINDYCINTYYSTRSLQKFDMSRCTRIHSRNVLYAHIYIYITTHQLAVYGHKQTMVECDRWHIVM